MRGPKKNSHAMGGGRSPKATGSPKAAIKAEKMRVAKKVGGKIGNMKFGGKA